MRLLNFVLFAIFIVGCASGPTESPVAPWETEQGQVEQTPVCEAGDASNCASLGESYRDGTGVAQDYKQAAALFRAACDAGHAGACNNLGALYVEGKGVE